VTNDDSKILQLVRIEANLRN